MARRMGLSGSTMKRHLEVGEQVASSSAIYNIWSEVVPCVEDRRRRCTLFVRHFADTDSKETRAFFENGIKTLRQLRHPYVVEYIDGWFAGVEANLLTERLWMLDLSIDSLPPIEIHTGLTHILDALVFLHDKAGLSHNNVCPSSVFVGGDGRWKLGSFECAQKLDDSRHWVQSDFVRSVKVPEFASPEDKLMLTHDIPPTARDAFAFGKLVYYVLPYLRDRLVEEILSELESVAEQLTDDEPSKRGALSSLSRLRPMAFTNTLSGIVEFLQTVHLKNDAQKAAFFGTVLEELQKIPEEVIGRRVVPVLMSRYVLLEECAHEKLLPFALRPRGSDETGERVGLLSEDPFKRFIVPELLKIFRVHETAVRLALLSHFHRFVAAFSEAELQNFVLPELSLGTKEVDDRIVCASLRAMADVVPLLGGSRVTGVPHSKIFADGTPKKSGMYTVERLEHNASSTAVSIKRYPMVESKESPLSVTSGLSQMLLEDDRSPVETNVRLELIPSPVRDRNEIDLAAIEDWDAEWESEQVEREVAELAGEQNDGVPEVERPREPLSSSFDTPNSQNPPNVVQKVELGSRKSTDIGAEYEIPSIGKISPKEGSLAEPDYFADMEPVICKAPSLLDYLSKEDEKKSSTPPPKTAVVTNRFAAVADDDTLETSNGLWDAAVVADWDGD